MRITKSVFIFFVCVISYSAQAIDFVLEGGLHAGGDTLVTATFTDGSTETIDAGEGLSLAIGARFDIADNLEMAITYGIKTAGISAQNGSIDWTRNPLNAILLYKMDNWRFGGGLTYHMSPVLEGDGFAAGKVDFEDALGTLIDMRYFFGESAYVGGRATFIDYKVKNGSTSVNGNSIGVIVGINL